MAFTPPYTLAVLSHNLVLPQLTHQPGKALARHHVVSALPPEHSAHQIPSHAEVTSHSSIQGPMRNNEAWPLATMTAPVGPLPAWWPCVSTYLCPIHCSELGSLLGPSFVSYPKVMASERLLQQQVQLNARNRLKYGKQKNRMRTLLYSLPQSSPRLGNRTDNNLQR